MIIWLWDTEQARGITDDPAQARDAAQAQMGDGTARVEQAVFTLGAESLTDGYRRTGSGWTGRRSDRGVYWTPLAVVA